jgi:DNA-binding LytR/AlgR family response regulator
MLKEAGFEVNAASKRVAHSMAVAVITAEGIKHLQNLPLTTETVRAASDELDKVFDTDAIENAMEPYFEALVEQIAAAHDLSDDQRTELESRLAYRWELLPLTEGE